MENSNPIILDLDLSKIEEQIEQLIAKISQLREALSTLKSENIDISEITSQFSFLDEVISQLNNNSNVTDLSGIESNINIMSGDITKLIDEIGELDSKLLTLSDDSAEYAQVNEQLLTKQSELNSVMVESTAAIAEYAQMLSKNDTKIIDDAELQNVKQLSDDINALASELGNLETGSEQYQLVLDSLDEKQDEFNTVMMDVTSQIAEQLVSIDELNNADAELMSTLNEQLTVFNDIKSQLSELEVGSDAYNTKMQELTETYGSLYGSMNNAIQSYGELRTNVESTNESLEKNDKTVKPLAGSINELKQQIKELNKEYNAVATQAERDVLAPRLKELRNQLKEFQMATGNTSLNVGNYTESINKSFSDLGGKINNVLGSLGKFDSFKGVSQLGGEVSKVTGLFETLGTAGSASLAIVGAAIAATVATVKYLFDSIKEGIESSEENTMSFAENVKSTWDGFRNYWSNTWQDVGAVAVERMGDVNTAWEGFFSDVQAGWKTLWRDIYQVFKPTIDRIQTGIVLLGTAFNAATKIAQNMALVVAKVIQDIVEELNKIPILKDLVPNVTPYDNLKKSIEEVNKNLNISKQLTEDINTLTLLRRDTEKEISDLQRQSEALRRQANEEGVRGTQKGIDLLNKQKEIEQQITESKLRQNELEIKIQKEKIESGEIDTRTKDELARLEAQRNNLLAEQERRLYSIDRQLRAQTRVMNTNNKSVVKMNEEWRKIENAVLNTANKINIDFSNSIDNANVKVEDLMSNLSSTEYQKVTRDNAKLSLEIIKSFYEQLISYATDASILMEKTAGMTKDELTQLNESLKNESASFKQAIDISEYDASFKKISELTSAFTQEQTEIISEELTSGKFFTSIEKLPQAIKEIFERNFTKEEVLSVIKPVYDSLVNAGYEFTDEQNAIIDELLKNPSKGFGSFPKEVKYIFDDIKKAWNNFTDYQRNVVSKALIDDTMTTTNKILEEYGKYKDTASEMLKMIKNQLIYLTDNSAILAKNKQYFDGLNEYLDKLNEHLKKIKKNNFDFEIKFKIDENNFTKLDTVAMGLQYKWDELMSSMTEEQQKDIDLMWKGLTMVDDNPYAYYLQMLNRYYSDVKKDYTDIFYTEEQQQSVEKLKKDIDVLDKNIDDSRIMYLSLFVSESKKMIDSAQQTTIWDVIFPTSHPNRKEVVDSLKSEVDKTILEISQYYSKELNTSEQRVNVLYSLLPMVSGTSGETEILEEIRAEKERIENAMVRQTEEAQAAMTEYVRKGAELRRQHLEEDINNSLKFANSIGSMFGAVADAYEADIKLQLEHGEITEEQAEKEFESIKSIQVAEAIISTIAGAIGAYMNDVQTIKPAWVGMAIGAIDAAATLAAGYAQVKNIENTTIGSSSGSLNANGLQGAAATPLLNESRDVMDLTSLTINADGNTEQRVYILESDIQKSNTRVSTREHDTSF